MVHLSVFQFIVLWSITRPFRFTLSTLSPASFRAAGQWRGLTEPLWTTCQAPKAGFYLVNTEHSADEEPNISLRCSWKTEQENLYWTDRSASYTTPYKRPCFLSDVCRAHIIIFTWQVTLSMLCVKLVSTAVKWPSLDECRLQCLSIQWWTLSSGS